MEPVRKNLTISISATSYKRARVWAANHEISLSRLVEAFLSTIDINKTALQCIGFDGARQTLVRRLDKGM